MLKRKGGKKKGISTKEKSERTYKTGRKEKTKHITEHSQKEKERVREEKGEKQEEVSGRKARHHTDRFPNSQNTLNSKRRVPRLPREVTEDRFRFFFVFVCFSRPSIRARPVRPLTVPPFALQLPAVLTRVPAKRPPAFPFALVRAALDAVSDALVHRFRRAVDAALHERERPLQHRLSLSLNCVRRRRRRRRRRAWLCGVLLLMLMLMLPLLIISVRRVPVGVLHVHGLLLGVRRRVSGR